MRTYYSRQAHPPRDPGHPDPVTGHTQMDHGSELLLVVDRGVRGLGGHLLRSVEMTVEGVGDGPVGEREGVGVLTQGWWPGRRAPTGPGPEAPVRGRPRRSRPSAAAGAARPRGVRRRRGSTIGGSIRFTSARVTVLRDRDPLQRFWAHSWPSGTRTASSHPRSPKRLLAQNRRHYRPRPPPGSTYRLDAIPGAHGPASHRPDRRASYREVLVLPLLVAAVRLGQPGHAVCLSAGNADHESQPQDHNPEAIDEKQLALRQPGVGGVPPV